MSFLGRGWGVKGLQEESVDPLHGIASVDESISQGLWALIAFDPNVMMTKPVVASIERSPVG